MISDVEGHLPREEIVSDSAHQLFVMKKRCIYELSIPNVFLNGLVDGGRILLRQTGFRDQALPKFRSSDSAGLTKRGGSRTKPGR